MKKTTRRAHREKKTPSALISQGESGSYVAKLFMNGRSQALRLPKELRFAGDEVYLKKVPAGVLIITDEERINCLMRAFGSIPDFPDRVQGLDQERPELDELFR
jgi:antitoxin VapB